MAGPPAWSPDPAGRQRRLPPGVTAVAPGPDQESVWDYPRPPALVADPRPVVVTFGEVVAETTGAYRVLETSHPPTWYLPIADVRRGTLRPVGGTSLCEWKGQASYFDVVATDGRVAERAGWTYPSPAPAFAALVDHVALYPAAVDRITVAGQPVTPQPGQFYGGWVTPDVVGPFKGGPGSWGW